MMDYCLVRLTSNDYRNFRDAYSRIVYSFCEKGKGGDKIAEAISAKIATDTSLRTRNEFLRDIQKREMYFFQIDGENQGFVELIFNEKLCTIQEFSVFERDKGWGSILLEETMRLIKERGCLKIELWCPFPGAQVFWQKKGFKPFYKKQQCIFEKKSDNYTLKDRICSLKLLRSFAFL